MWNTRFAVICFTVMSLIFLVPAMTASILDGILMQGEKDPGQPSPGTSLLNRLQDFGKAYAVSQWSRKYNTPCSTCHYVFPRLNPYGERFMRNGFQDPDNDAPDGGTLRKKQHDALNVGLLEDYFGFRISFQPLYFEKDGLTRNGAKEDRIDVGKFNWIQLFTAGTITENVAFFNELEFSDTGAVKHGWFTLGFHNLTSTPGLVNIQMGRISPVEWTSFSNRLRVFPEIQALADKVTSSKGVNVAPEDSVDISSSQPGISYFGYRGPLIWSVGTGNGKNTTDVNQFKSYWGSLRAEVPEGDSLWEGSSVSLFYYAGTDTAATATAQQKNKFTRLQPSFNIRWGTFDIIGSYHWAEEDNFDLATGDEERYQGVTGIVSYLYDSNVQAGLEYDSIQQRDLTSLEKERLAVHLSYLLRENVNLILTTDFDLQDDRHKYFTTIRSMF